MVKHVAAQIAAVEAERDAGQGKPRPKAKSPATATPANKTPPPQPTRPGNYGTVAYAHYQGVRFVATNVPPACEKELQAVCERHGLRPADTSHFITESSSH